MKYTENGRSLTFDQRGWGRDQNDVNITHAHTQNKKTVKLKNNSENVVAFRPRVLR